MMDKAYIAFFNDRDHKEYADIWIHAVASLLKRLAMAWWYCASRRWKKVWL